MCGFEPLNLVEWFWGDIGKLDPKHRRLRIKFHNSLRYRAKVLDFYVIINLIDESALRDVTVLHRELVKMHTKNPIKNRDI